MQFLITGKNLEVSDWMRSYIEKKFGKLDRFLSMIQEIRVELSAQPTKSANHRYVCQVTVRSRGNILRAEERAGDIRDAIDIVIEKMYSQIERYKGKHWDKRFGAEAESAIEEEALEEEGATVIVRRKRFVVSPMDEQEAVQQMELLGHDFYVFTHAESNVLNVIYRRNDGDYGLIQPRV